MKVFVVYGDKQKYEFKTIAKYDFNALCEAACSELIKFTQEHQQLGLAPFSK